MSSDKKDVLSNIKQMQPKAECTKKIFHSLQKLHFELGNSSCLQRSVDTKMYDIVKTAIFNIL